MHAKQKTETLPCTPGAFPGGLSRTRFYDGMLLTQLHMEREQNYWRMKRKLTNRALGNGVVWGLRLEWDASTRKFLLSPGYALDCCGNDLIVECPQEVTEQVLVDKHDPQIQALLSGKTNSVLKCPEPDRNLPRKACIVLKYTECAGDPQPIFEDDCTSNVTHCEYSSVRESARLCLVPPPTDPTPTPIDNFCRQLEKLKGECAALEQCKLFDMESELGTSELPVYVEIRGLGGSGFEPKQVQALLGDDASVALPTFDREDQLQVLIRPAPGYVLLGGDLAGEQEWVEFGVFGAQFQVPGSSFLDADGPAFTIQNLLVGALFANRGKLRVDLRLATPSEGDDVILSVSTDNYQQFEPGPVCNDQLKPWLIFADEPECTLKTIALTALCGWFRGLLNDESRTTSEDGISYKDRAAWLVCYLAWKLLFGANLDNEKSQVLSDAFNTLLEEWCAAFFYPGPYCHDDHHGVYLGCVEISAKGNVLSFDPWAHRRYVITGPLLSHWGSSFGLAPIDTIVGRFAGWICCLGQTTIPALQGGIPDLINGLPLDQSGAALVGGGQDAAAAEAAVVEYMERYELKSIDEPETVSGNEFATLVLELMVRSQTREKADLSSVRRDYVLGDTGLHLLMPVSAQPSPLPAAEANVVSELLRSQPRPVRPMMQDVLNAYVPAVVRAVELPELKLTIEDEVVNVLAQELRQHNIVTIEDYLKVGPLRAAELALINFEELEEVVENKRAIFLAAEELALASKEVLNAVVEPFVTDTVEIRNGLLLRENMAEDKIAEAVSNSVKDHLKRNTLSRPKLKKIGQRIAEG